MKKNCKEILTIRHIINSLNDIMTRSSNITLDSEIIISDTNYQEYEDLILFPIKDIFYGENKVKLCLKPKEVSKEYKEEKEIIQQEILGKETRLEDSEVKQEPVQTNNNWWEKYK